MDIRKPAVSGIFYPADQHELNAVIDGFLKKVSDTNYTRIPLGFIVPHAGYIYSGQVAAQAYALAADQDIDTVIVIAPSHHVSFNGVSVNPEYYETPLGVCPVDHDFITRLRAYDEMITTFPAAHTREHSLEVQVPFIQKVLPAAQLVPIVMGSQSFDVCERLAEALGKVAIGKKCLLIASSDMSHYYDYKTACAMDAKTRAFIKQCDARGLYQHIASGKGEMCGIGPVVTLMLYAQALGAGEPVMLDYATSGDTAGSKDKVVGYMAATFFMPAGPADLSASAEASEEVLTPTEGKRLIEIARQTIEQYVRNRTRPIITVTTPALQQEVGVFVTLWKHGNLRGCIGRFQPDKALSMVVQDMAIASATKDHRFSPVRPDELTDITIEISVLSPFKRIYSLTELIPGKHGIYVRQGSRSGTYLPEVAVKTGWTAQEFVEHCLMEKAGLSADAWQEGAEMYIYTATVFHEEK